VVDPQSLETSLAPAAGASCASTAAAAEAGTRFQRAIAAAAAARSPRYAKVEASYLRDAGLDHGRGGGAFVTADLCPSPRPLDRAFLERLMTHGPRQPVALAVSGLWLLRHRADFDWIMGKVAAGALDVTWIDHSYHHPFDPRARIQDTFLRKRGIDMATEILATEKLLIADGGTPSAFFRFPGLVSDPGLMAKVASFHLVTVGADGWLALGEKPTAGGVILVHANGNEPAGLRLFGKLDAAGGIPGPLRRLEDAP
ncbi:MAG: polysaccharide deacetylase, partial [Hyphomicrobiales bacterium]|nr:polysaccharide deacetylase [Hyphomicrobiales bacterium]